MKLTFAKSMWEAGGSPLGTFIERVKKDGFDATEIYLKSVREEPETIRELHQEYGLECVAQIITEGKSPEEHIASFERQFERAAESGAVSVNSHTGRDIFSFTDNVRIIGRAIEIAGNAGIPLRHETHRGRPTYSAVETRKYLEALPKMRLTADVSHWMVVHESDLEDQPENIDAAVGRTDQIHARIGYAEGPQVPEPRAPEWSRHVENHLRIWRRIIAARKRDGAPSLIVTPEFGPPDYMHTLPYTGMPVADAWEINVFMKGFLEERLALRSEDST